MNIVPIPLNVLGWGPRSSTDITPIIVSIFVVDTSSVKLADSTGAIIVL